MRSVHVPASGAMRVHADAASWIMPPHRAVCVPAATPHSEQMHGPISVRTLYFVAGLVKTLPRSCSIVNVSSLLRELVLRASRLGVLNRKVPSSARLIGVLLDELTSASEEPLQLPMPRDRRARRFAAMLAQRPDERGSVGELARRIGASRRTIERVFRAETHKTVGEWRRRLRLLHGVPGGESVTNAALDSGYSSPSAFIAALKKTMRVTPSRYALAFVTRT